MRQFPRPTSCVLATVLFGCVLPGCSSSDSAATGDQAEVTFSEEFEENGVRWTKSPSLTDGDIRQLAAYLKSNSSLAEGPLVSGDPVLYRSSKRGKRFYWGQVQADEPRWLYIQFDQRKPKVHEGSGPPLEKPSS